MPFRDDLKEVYWKSIKPACLEAGFDCLRVDELKGPFSIHRKIIDYIFNSEIIVADLTGWNPNVFYEMGVAHTLSNKTIMIIQKEDKLPFDVHAYNCIQYEQTKTGLEKLKGSIKDSLLTFNTWRSEPTNPVQEFKPKDTFITRIEYEKLQLQLKDYKKLLENSVPIADYEILKEKMEQTKHELDKYTNKNNSKEKNIYQEDALVQFLARGLAQEGSKMLVSEPKSWAEFIYKIFISILEWPKKIRISYKIILIIIAAILVLILLAYLGVFGQEVASLMKQLVNKIMEMVGAKKS